MRSQVAVLALGFASIAGAQDSSDAGRAFVQRVIAGAIAQTARQVVYDGSYRRIPYPGGDVPPDVGVCTDLVIRAYRAAGVDLQ